MSKATNTKLMETEPGGEQTQYEGSHTTAGQEISPNNPTSSSSSAGQFSGSSSNPTDTSSSSSQSTARGEKTAENIRYGEAISEHGFGGETTGNSGHANQDSGFGEIEDQSIEGQQSRREQGYGGGSGVGG